MGMPRRVARATTAVCPLFLIYFLYLFYESGQPSASPNMAHIQRGDMEGTICKEILGFVPTLHFLFLTDGKVSKASKRPNLFACAIEAAWQFADNMPIVIWTNMPIRELSKIVNNNHYTHLCPVDFPAIFKGTPLQGWYDNYPNNHSTADGPYILNDLSDALRLAILYKVGGLYIDADVLLLRNGFTRQKSNVAVGSTNNQLTYNNAYLQFPQGHSLLLALMEDFANKYDGFKWGRQGPELLARVIKPCIQDADPVCRDLVISGEEHLYVPVQYTAIVAKLNSTSHDFKLADWFNTGILALHWFNHMWEQHSPTFCIAHESIMHHIVSHVCPTGAEQFRIC
jgi:hypothetical protein